MQKKTKKNKIEITFNARQMGKTSKLKKTIRDSKKYPALEKSVTLKTRQDLVDYDYLDKLSPEELEFLNKFTEETVSTSFKKKDGKYSGNLYKKRSLKERTLGC